jgi:hypothetical protein
VHSPEAPRLTPNAAALVCPSHQHPAVASVSGASTVIPEAATDVDIRTPFTAAPLFLRSHTCLSDFLETSGSLSPRAIPKFARQLRSSSA